VPGVSRNGVTLTAARALGFDHETAFRLSWQAGLPVIGGATLLKLTRVAQRGLDRELRAPFAAGAAAAFAATLAASPLLRVRRQRVIAGYRVALGAFALHRLEWPRG
jgi:undecaprenyl-diphosphatase